MKNDKFTFVNDVESDILEDSMIIRSNSETQKEPQFDVITEEERYERFKLVRAGIIMLMISAGVFVFTLYWQDSVSLLAICNSLTLVAVLQFAAGWMILMSNMNILSPLIYGAKTFGKMITGKRISTNYYEYSRSVEENQIPKLYYKFFFFSALVFSVPAVILLFIVL